MKLKLSEIMTREVEVIHPDDSLQTAARKMRDNDIGLLPVCDGDRLIGVVSDRDLAIRAVALGTDPNTMLGRDLITAPVLYCYEDQDIRDAAHLMRQNQIRRLIILNNAKRLVGIVSLCDLVNNGASDLSGKILQGISERVVASR